MGSFLKNTVVFGLLSPVDIDQPLKIYFVFSDVQVKDVVAIATQRRFTTTADLSNLFYTLEAMSGISRLALRDAESLDPYALVFQKGRLTFLNKAKENRKVRYTRGGRKIRIACH